MEKGKLQKGSSIIEVLVATTVITLSISAATVLTFSNQNVVLDSDTAGEALYRAKTVLEGARAVSKADFNSLSDIVYPLDSIYTKSMNVEYYPCRLKIESKVNYSSEILRPQVISLVSEFTDTEESYRRGGDCSRPTSDEFDNPNRFASDTTNPGKTLAIDVLNKIVYLGVDKTPYLYIADTNGTYLGQNSGLIINPFSNSFNSSGKILDKINDIDAFRNFVNGKTYVIIAMASTTAQFAIVEVTDPHSPVLINKIKLAGVTGSTITSEGYRIYYYDKKAYIVTRETLGPEFHVIDLSNPAAPFELGSGTNLIGPTPPNGTTVNDLVVRDGIAYMAAEKLHSELLIYDVSTPSTPVFMAGATVDLPGADNGASVYIAGGRLYFSREKTSGGPEFYIFDILNARTVSGGLPVIGTPLEVNSGVYDIDVMSEKSTFLVTDKTNEEFQIWDTSSPSLIKLVKKYNFGNIVAGGVDYEGDFVYATGSATPNFQILYDYP